MIFLVYTLYITVYTPMFYYKKQVPAIMVETCTLSGVIPGGRTISATDFYMGHNRAGRLP